MTEILWLAPDKPENLSIGRGRIAHELEQRGYSITQLADTKHLLLEASRNKYDTVISSCPRTNVLAPIAKATGKRFVVDYVDPILQLHHAESFPLAQIGHTLQATGFRLADAIIYVYSEETLRVNRFDKPTVKTTLGVDYDRYQEAEPMDDLPDPFAVYIGGLEPIYNIETLLDSAIGNYNLVIAGTGSKRDYVSIKATEHEEITYLGILDHGTIPRLLAAADVGVNLADDPHTVKVLEYAAAGLPIVHATGRAEGTLPQSVRYTEIDPTIVAEQVQSAMRDRTHPELRHFAKERDYELVADDYEKVIS